MKKRLFLFTVFTFFFLVSSANCSENYKKVSSDSSCECGIESQAKDIKNNCKNSISNKKDDSTNKETKRPCNQCDIDNEDDEYCTYNQCFFDKHYRNMKRALCLTRRQETCIDNYYRNFKSDMEALCVKYKNERNALLKIIECNEGCYKEQKNNLKEIKKESKERLKEFREEIKEQLCKNQLSDFGKFQRSERKKFKKIAKYSVVYKFPCVNCANCGK